MSADDSLKNWQIAENSKGGERYALTGSETEPPKQMQLQEDASGGSQWQPIDYRRQSGPRRNWILPSVVIVALLGVLAYVGWIAVGQVAGGTGSGLPSISVGGLLDLVGGQVAPTPEPTEALVAVAVETPVVEEPTAVVEPSPVPVEEPTATATPLPTPAPVALTTGVVTEAAGVNARREPSTTAEVVRLLAQNAAVTVVATQEGWLQVILDDNTVAWVSADFIEQKSELVALERLNQVLTAAGLPPQQPVLEATAPVAGTPGIILSALVIGEPGINARNTPDLVSGVTVMQLPKETALSVVGRTEDSQWLAVELPEGGYGWVLTQFVSLEGDTTTLAVVTPDALAALAAAESAPATEPAAVVPLEPTVAAVPVPSLPVLVVSPIVPPAPFTNTLPLGAAVAISDAVGVNARATPSAEGELLLVVPNGAVLPALGRSADDQWIQVQLPDGTLAWMARTVVNVSDNIDSAPVGGVDSAPATLSTATPVAAVTTPAATTPAAAIVIPADAPIATVTNALGANLRSVPDRNANPVVTVNSGDAFPAIGRSADSAWVQLALPDGTTGWALATTISLDADVNSLPVAP